ncbi:hypothetical protein ES703_44987 [subsurface metagenome]
MRLFGNTFGGYRVIKGYSKEEILSIKNSISSLKSDKTKSQEIEDFLKSEFKLEVLNSFTEYFNEIKPLCENYLFSQTKKDYYSLKTVIIDELKLISSNLTNLSSNSRNVKRFVTNGENDISLWIEANKIKNLSFQLNLIPDGLNNWKEIQELDIYIQSLVEAKTTKKIKSRKGILLTFHFDELYQFFLSKSDGKKDFYGDLIYLLYQNKIFEEFEGEEFVNVLERKESVQRLRDKMRPIIIALIKDKLKENLQELEDLDKQYDLTGNGQGKLDLNSVMEQKFSEFLPQVVDFYFKGIDKKFQGAINDVSDSKEFVKIVNSNYEKVDDFALKIDEIDTWILTFDKILKPYESITATLKKTLTNIISEIIRRKEEYINYLNSIKDESLRVDVRSFVDEKIAEVNKLISSYEDETSVIIREELPQLREIKDLLTNYKVKIEQIKEEVYIKLDTYKESKIDMYSIIKYWEDNFNRKKQQLTFLLTVLMNKIFKSFKDLIDKESILFAEITEITKQTENFEGLPLNFALSSFLANKLSTSSLGLYQVELSKIEEILSTKVKIREGVSVSNVQCTVCHKHINFAKDKLITCPFCGSTYHYLCVADWLAKYNSCPMCQNQYLDPNLGLFETE